MESKILLAGATGYLGGYILKELVSRNIPVRTIVRDPSRIAGEIMQNSMVEVLTAQVTKPESIRQCCEGIDTVISTVGITRQKDGLTYMNVDFRANANLVDEAKSSGVRKFIYVSVLNGEKLRRLKICEAKERLVDYLKESGVEYCIIRPNGFFSDMGDFLKMARRGRIYLFGDGTLKLNPIHGADLAKVCVDDINKGGQEISIGGPEVLSQNEIGALALKAWSKEGKIVHLPDWIRRFTLWTLRTLTSQKTYGPAEFFLTTMAMEMVAPTYGIHTLGDYFSVKTKEG